MKLHENYPDSPTRILVLWKKKSLLQMEHFFFFSSGRKEGVKRSNTFVSVQHCCIKEPHKNNKKKFSVKGNLQPTPKINKMEWKIQNLSIILTVKCSNFNRLPFKYKLILCYNIYNAQLSGLQDPNIYWPPFRLPNMIFPVTSRDSTAGWTIYPFTSLLHHVLACTWTSLSRKEYGRNSSCKLCYIPLRSFQEQPVSFLTNAQKTLIRGVEVVLF